MAEVDRETVVVEGDRRSSYGWVIALGVILLIIVLFFLFGGANMFNGGAETVNVDTPDSVQVQPTTQQ